MNKSSFAFEIFYIWAIIYTTHVIIENNYIAADKQIATLIAPLNNQCTASRNTTHLFIAGSQHEQLQRTARWRVTDVIRSAHIFDAGISAIVTLCIMCIITTIIVACAGEHTLANRVLKATSGARWYILVSAAVSAALYEQMHIRGVVPATYDVTDSLTCYRTDITVRENCTDEYEGMLLRSILDVRNECRKCETTYISYVGLLATNTVYDFRESGECKLSTHKLGFVTVTCNEQITEHRCALRGPCIRGRSLGKIVDMSVRGEIF